MIDLDITAVVQFCNFLITLVVLNYLLITPIRKVLRQRKESMEKMQGSVMKADEAAELKLADYKSSLAKFREEAVANREAIRNEAVAKEREISEAALAGAHTKIRAARAEIAAEVDRAMGELKESVPALAREAVGKIMA